MNRVENPDAVRRQMKHSEETKKRMLAAKRPLDWIRFEASLRRGLIAITNSLGFVGSRAETDSHPTATITPIRPDLTTE